MRGVLTAAFIAAFFFAALFISQPSARAACPDSDALSAAMKAFTTVYSVSGDESSDDEAEDADAEDEDSVPQPDTTITVRPGTSLEIENFGGSIDVKTWDKDALKIAADHSLRDRVMIVRTGSAIRLKVKSGRWVPASVRYRIVAPRWMKLELSGVNTDIDVQDSRAEVRAETVQGDISCRSSTGFVSLSSVQGAILAQDVRGRVEATSVNEVVRLTRVIGVIVAESVNGGIEIEGAVSDSVEASTINGPVTYQGTVNDVGTYRFATHNGCIDVVMPEKSNATVSLSTFSGGIDTSFPVTLKKIRSKRFQTTLGTGLAKFELESFQGTIFLRRPGDARQQCEVDEDEDKADKTEKHEKVHKADKKADKGDSDEDSGDEE
jgi:hypothetical protein